MNREPINLTLGDPCPACGGELKAARVPTDEQLAAATQRENPTPLPPFMDSAPTADRAELGALYACDRCRYKTRFKDAPAKAKGGKRELAGAGKGE